jgi:type II secretory pathway pseudopilin PulG
LAKWRIGEAAPVAKEHDPFALVAPRPQSKNRFVRAQEARCSSSDDGFTLIELVIVCAVMPLVIGAIAVGILSIFTLQTSVSSRLTDSGDAQLVSFNIQNDVQSAVQITTNSSPTNPAPCLPTGSTQVQVLALQLGNAAAVGSAPVGNN